MRKRAKNHTSSSVSPSPTRHEEPPLPSVSPRVCAALPVGCARRWPRRKSTDARRSTATVATGSIVLKIISNVNVDL